MSSFVIFFVWVCILAISLTFFHPLVTATLVFIVPAVMLYKDFCDEE